MTDGDVWTSALATARFLSDQRPEGSVFGNAELIEEIVRRDLSV